jgi:hypothetical protein
MPPVIEGLGVEMSDIHKWEWILNKIKELESFDKDLRFSPRAGEGTPSNIVDLSAVELSDAIKDKVVSCVDVMKSYLAQIDKLNPTFNAIVSPRNRDELFSEAAQKDSELAKGIYHGRISGKIGEKHRNMFSFTIEGATSLGFISTAGIAYSPRPFLQ